MAIQVIGGVPAKEYHRRRYESTMKKLRDYLGGKCVKCGALENLEFHHRDPSEKKFSIGSRWNRSFDSLVEELDKCVLLCKIHHDECTMNGEHNMRNRYGRWLCSCGEPFFDRFVYAGHRTWCRN